MSKVHVFFDDDTKTLSYVVHDLATRDAVVIDPVWDFDPAAVRTSLGKVEAIRDYVRYHNLEVRLILETHPHADHLSAAYVLKQLFPNAQIGIGEGVKAVQKHFRDVFQLGPSFPIEGQQFDRLFVDGEIVKAGSLSFQVLATPGHTPACVSYRFDSQVFVGDTLFMPDYGTGRCDFPGGCSKTLFHSVTTKLYALPDSTILYSGHDYQPEGRPVRWEAMVGEQKRSNIHINQTTSEAQFVSFRQNRDKTLSAPRYFFPSLLVNINGGQLPKPEQNGVSYLKMPINYLKFGA